MNTIAKRCVQFLLVFALTAPVASYSAGTSTSGAAAGRVIVGVGQLAARSLDGTKRSLKRRSSVYPGDTILTGRNAFVQIRFSDGGLVSLRPGTEFRIDEYHFKGKEDGNENVIFSLLKGGLRTISGRIGKKNKNKYRLNTTIATIGIRGTHYGVRLCQSDCPAGFKNGLWLGVLDGGIGAKNGSGGFVIWKDGYFHFSDKNSPPTKLKGPPGIVFGNFEPGPGGKISLPDDPKWNGLPNREPVFIAPRNVAPGGGGNSYPDYNTGPFN